MMSKVAHAASLLAIVLGGALALAGSASAADQTTSAPAPNPAASSAAQKDANAAEAVRKRATAAEERAAKKAKRRSGLVYAQPSLAMDPDPFLALASPAVGFVYGIPRRQ